jgi:NTE family protein
MADDKGLGSTLGNTADETEALIAQRREEKRFDLVLEGGGVKGIGLAGALSVLEERGYTSQCVAGTSAGAIVATLHAAGYRAEELREIISSLDFTVFRDEGWKDRIPIIGKGLSILIDHGIYEGDAFYAWAKEKLAAKGVKTFADFPRVAEKDKVQVIVSDVTERQLLVLPRDAGKLGLEPDELEVALAVRMSMSIPIFFEPVKHKNPKTGRTHVLVDGGMLSNFPVWLFDAPGLPRWPTFGLTLVEDDPKVSIAARLSAEEVSEERVGVVGFIKSLVQTMLEAHDRLYIEKANFARTITIPTLGVNTVDFGLPKERALALYDSGRRAAERFLEAWDFHAYIAEFRTGKEHSRREDIAEEMREAVAAEA